MKLKQIEIEKFRTISRLTLTISDMLILIGENNAGKSNILRAIQLFFQDSIRGVDEECFCYKDCSTPISITFTFDRLTDGENQHKILRNWINNDEIRVKKVISCDATTSKYSPQLFGWQAKPVEPEFDLDRFDEYKSRIKAIVEEKGLPDYFKNDKGAVTQASYKEGVRAHIESGQVEMGAPGWMSNPGGYKEVFGSLLPRFYMVHAVKDAQEESKTTQQTVFGKLINDLTHRIVGKNPKFEEIKKEIDGLKRFLNRPPREDDDGGGEGDRLQEIKELETTLSMMLSESMPDTTVEIEVVTPELIDLFKDVIITIDDSFPTSIDSKGHGLQRALIFAYIRAYARLFAASESTGGEDIETSGFILAIEEPELYLHPNGQRKMLNVLKEISGTDQVLLSTHSSFFVNMHEYKDIAVVRRKELSPTTVVQCLEDLFESEDDKKVFRYLSLFDVSRSEMFFAKKAILVEGDTEKVIIPFWASAMAHEQDHYDLSAQNVCVVECGGKYNMRIFMKVLNQFKIPYVAVHDIDPIDFPEDKANKNDKEKQSLRTFKENGLIARALDEDVGRIIRVHPDLEEILEVSGNQIEKHGKVRAAYMKYEPLTVEQYPEGVKNLLNLLMSWDDDHVLCQIGGGNLF